MGVFEYITDPQAIHDDNWIGSVAALSDRYDGLLRDEKISAEDKDAISRSIGTHDEGNYFLEFLWADDRDLDHVDSLIQAYSERPNRAYGSFRDLYMRSDECHSIILEESSDKVSEPDPQEAVKDDQEEAADDQESRAWESASAAYESDREAVRAKPKEDWIIRLSSDFLKSVSRLDTKSQGRVLKAITQIVKNPTKPVGNTAKPLTGDMKGLWRWRIGDFRLVYDPNVQDKAVVLLTVGARGGVYR